MKKVLSIIMALLTVLSLSACNSFDDERESSYSIQEGEIITNPQLDNDENPSQSQNDQTMTSDIYKPSSQNEVTEQQAIFQTKSFDFIDDEGYSYLVTIKISPWILFSKKFDTLQTIWKSLTETKDLPTIESWNFTRESPSNYYMKNCSDNSWFRCRKSMFDMYYSVGQIIIENKTNGFDITEKNSRTLHMRFHSDSFFDNRECDKDVVCVPAICKVFYNNPEIFAVQDEHLYDIPAIDIGNPLLKSNTWSVLFVLAHGESSTPNEPQGLYRDYLKKNNTLTFTISTQKLLAKSLKEVSFELEITE